MVADSIWKKIADPAHTFIIAEAGVNHNGRLDLAKKLVDAAVRAGADAVKFQAFKAERLASLLAPKATYQMKTTGKKGSQLEMLRKLELSARQHTILSEYCKSRKIVFLSSPFDEQSADELELLKLPLFKIPSGEITNIPFLIHVARKGKPIILSTGMADLREVANAVRTIRKSGSDKIALLQCVSNYPADPRDVNLKAMDTMQKKFRVPVGFSDHTEGIEIAAAAVARGASIIEKHFTLDRTMAGPDHRASLEPNELAALVRAIRNVEHALGSGVKEPAESEADTARAARKSLVAARDIAAGTLLTREMIALKRPGTGLSPDSIPRLVGNSISVSLKAGELFSLETLSLQRKTQLFIR